MRTIGPVMSRMVGGCSGLRRWLKSNFRALVLASADIAWLRAVHVMSDGSLEGFAGLEAPVHPEKIVEGRVVLLTELLELLKGFIGENLTMQIVPSFFKHPSMAYISDL